MIDESKLIQTIVLAGDWQEVLTSIVVEEQMDPVSIDIVELTNAFMTYLQRLKNFSFRIPARFVLIAAILLRMKCELLLEEEEKKQKEAIEQFEAINIENIPQLAAPMERRPTRKVTLMELINALNKTTEFKKKKEEKQIRLKERIENLIEPEEDIEIKIKRVFDEIIGLRETSFFKLVPVWKRKEIIEVFLPLLYLMQRGKISCGQEETFKDITVRIL